MNTTDVSRLHEEHLKLKRILARIRKHAVSHYDVHVSAKNKEEKNDLFIMYRSFTLREKDIVD